MGYASEFVRATKDEATEAADAIYKRDRITMFIRVVQDGDEWGFEALETTMSGKLATVGGFPDYAYETRDEALGKIDGLMAPYKATRIK